MIHKILVLGLFSVVSFMANAQQIITLSRCQQLAYDNYPLMRQKLYVDDIELLQSKTIRSAFNPQFNLEAQSTWQNEVTGLGISLPGMSIDPLDKLQYKSQVVFSQVIYSGGKKSLQQNLSKANSTVDKLKLESELYTLRFIINKAYFTALLMQENIASFEAMNTALEANKKDVDAGIANGTLTADKLAAIDAEIITIQQGIINLESQRKAALNTLSLYTGTSLKNVDMLQIPEVEVTVSRPEYDLFEQQKILLQLSNNLIDASRKPSLAGFGQLGYGKPGFNMLKNEMTEFYLVGAKLTWKITDWNASKRSKKINSIQQLSVDVQKEIFDIKMNDLVQQQETHLDYLNRVLISDEDMLKARYAIVEVSENQLRNGEIRSSDYITDLQNAVSAEITHKQHLVEKSMTLIAIETLRGEAHK